MPQGSSLKLFKSAKLWGVALATLQPSPFWVFISYNLQKMTKAEKNEILNAPSLGYWSGCGGVEFKRFDYDINDYAVFVAGARTSKPSVHRAKIRYHLKSGDAYLLYNGYVVNFSDTIRA